MSKTKYAPAREDGMKPYHVTISEWGQQYEKIIYAATTDDAKYKAVGRMRYIAARVRRATPDDVKRLQNTEAPS